LLVLYQILDGFKISGSVVALKLIKDGGEFDVVPSTDDVYIYTDDIIHDRVRELCRELETIFDDRRNKPKVII